MLNLLYKLFTSVKLAVVLLALGLILVFWGTLAQVNVGLYKAQNEFFRSMFIYWQPAGSNWRIPVFPGGYLVGGLLVINLFAAHLRYYKPGLKKIGIAAIHIGIVLLLLGQFATDMLSTESFMIIREGQSANFSESNSRFELAVVDVTDPQSDKVLAIPGQLLAKGEEISRPALPFKVRAKQYYVNSSLKELKADESKNEQATKFTADGFKKVQARNDLCAEIWWRELPHETKMNQRDIPSSVVELLTPQGQLGPYLVSGWLNPQEINYAGRRYRLSLRPERYYKPFSLHLIDFRFDRYPGTEIPKNFSSRVKLQHPEAGENREYLIRMNEPLRYAGETFFQADWDKTDEKGTVLQVVRNPSWLTPYLACVLVAGGLIWQFLSHLIGFAAKRRLA